MIQLIEPSRFKTVPWKNGGGTATDIAAEGDVWRVALAAILKDGPFSDHAGVTRTFTIVEGQGVHLDFAGQGTRTLGRDRPTRFAGAPAPFCRLRGGPAKAFNLFTRDGAASGDVAIVSQGATLAPADTTVILALEGDWRLEGLAVPEGSAALAEGGGLALAGTGRAAVATIRR